MPVITVLLSNGLSAKITAPDSGTPCSGMYRIKLPSVEHRVCTGMGSIADGFFRPYCTLQFGKDDAEIQLDGAYDLKATIQNARSFISRANACVIGKMERMLSDVIPSLAATSYDELKKFECSVTHEIVPGTYLRHEMSNDLSVGILTLGIPVRLAGAPEIPVTLTLASGNYTQLFPIAFEFHAAHDIELMMSELACPVDVRQLDKFDK